MLAARLKSLTREAVQPLWRALPPWARRSISHQALRGRVLYGLLVRRGSPFVSGYLNGLRGVEVGAAAHNCFYLDAINVDRDPSRTSVYKRAERRLALRTAPVDVVAPGDALPFADGSYDFVFASHVIEHFPDPIRALREWVRVARRYVVVVVPHRDRTFDRDRELTAVAELLARHRDGFSSEVDRHWSVWNCETFLAMCEAAGSHVIDSQDPDDKVGNGFAVVIDPREGSAVAGERPRR